MKKQPNILFIHTDQQRTDTMGCYGNELIKTPNIDEFAKSAVTFTNAHCSHPLCSPSRATWITGEYIHSHGLWRNGTALDPNRENVVKSLAENGYGTCVVGKAHLVPYNADQKIFAESMHLDNMVCNPTPEECWDYWKNNKFENGYYGYNDVRLALGHGDYGMSGGHYGLWVHENHPDKLPLFKRENGKSEDTSFDAWKSKVPLEVHSTTWITDQVDEYISSHKDSPWFLSIGFQEPHPPFQPPEPYCDMYNPEDMPDPIGSIEDFGENLPEHIRHYITRDGITNISLKRIKEILALYYGMMTLVDDAVGRILKSLEDNGLSEDTLVVFTSDHGDWMGDHGLNRKGGVHITGLTQIPMIIRWPGVSKSGLRVDSVASQVDLAATFYDVAGLRPHFTNQGKSLRKVLSGEISKNREYALIEHCHECYHQDGKYENNMFSHLPVEERKDIVQRNIINHTEEDMFMKTIVTDTYRFTMAPTYDGYGELYNHVTDPKEEHNLYGIDMELQKQAEKQLLLALIQSTPRCQERTFDV